MTNPVETTRDAAPWYQTYWNNQRFLASWTKETSAEVDFLEHVLQLRGEERILDIGCGQGRHSRELARRGYHVVGVDISEELVSFARDAPDGALVEFIVCDALSLQYEKCFDVTLNLYDGAIGYFEEDRKNEQLIENTARALVPGGRSVVHVQNADYFSQRGTHTTWSTDRETLTLTRYIWLEECHRLLHSGHILSLGAPLPHELSSSTCADYRLYTLDEIGEVLARHGLATQQVFSAFNEQSPKAVAVGKELTVLSMKTE